MMCELLITFLSMTYSYEGGVQKFSTQLTHCLKIKVVASYLPTAYQVAFLTFYK